MVLRKLYLALLCFLMLWCSSPAFVHAGRSRPQFDGWNVVFDSLEDGYNQIAIDLLRTKKWSARTWRRYPEALDSLNERVRFVLVTLLDGQPHWVDSVWSKIAVMISQEPVEEIRTALWRAVINQRTWAGNFKEKYLHLSSLLDKKGKTALSKSIFQEFSNMGNQIDIHHYRNMFVLMSALQGENNSRSDLAIFNKLNFDHDHQKGRALIGFMAGILDEPESRSDFSTKAKRIHALLKKVHVSFNRIKQAIPDLLLALKGNSHKDWRHVCDMLIELNALTKIDVSGIEKTLKKLSGAC